MEFIYKVAFAKNLGLYFPVMFIRSIAVNSKRQFLALTCHKIMSYPGSTHFKWLIRQTNDPDLDKEEAYAVSTLISLKLFRNFLTVNENL